MLLCLILGFIGCKDRSNNTDSVIIYAIEKPYYKGPLRVQIRLQKATMPLSGFTALEIITEIDPEYEIQFPAINEVLKQFKIQNAKEQSETMSGNNKPLKVYHYDLEPLEVGQCEIPSLTFTFVPKDPQQQGLNQSTLVTEPLWIEVTTSLPVDMQDITIEDIEDVVEMKDRYHWAWFLVGPIVLVIIVTATIALLCKKKTIVETKRIYKSAHQIAFEMLKTIADEKMIEQGQIKLFYEKLSGCLRQYIENRFQLRAPEQTTEEFLENLKTSSVLQLEYKQELQKFLEHCDLVKFARYQPSNEQINESLTIAEQFVEKTKSDEYMVDVTNQSPAERQVV
jgi:hypothetical protein